MKKFIIKTSCFIVPFLFLHFLNFYFYNQEEGGLTRVGYLYTNPSPKSEVAKQFSMNKNYTCVSELDFTKKSQFDVFVIGDSFSDQDSLGYKSFLSDRGISVLYMDRNLSDNPIQTLIKLINGGFFENVKVNNIVLQSVEREFVQRTQNNDFSEQLQLEELKFKISKLKKEVPDRSLNFFSDATLQIPLTNIQYFFNQKPTYSKTYKVKTSTTNLFSGNPTDLLFYEDDLNYMKFKNDTSKIDGSNAILNKINKLLSEKNTNFIFFISPDKFDLYYPYILNKGDFEAPLFFTYFNKLNKEYEYLNTLQILSKEIKTQKDIYYYDDTHWSAIAGKIMANELYLVIEKNNNQTNSKFTMK